MFEMNQDGDFSIFQLGSDDDIRCIFLPRGDVGKQFFILEGYRVRVYGVPEFGEEQFQEFGQEGF